MRVLITGASGLAGSYLARSCTEAGDDVVGLVRNPQLPPGVAGEALAVDLEDAAAVRQAVREARPGVVYHLAALSSVGRSWEQPAETVAANVGGGVNLLEALRLEAPSARVVWVSSCEVYGNPASLPIPEDAAVRPESPYAVSKAAGEQLARVYAEAYGLEVITARPFSHTGPGQRPIFILSSLAKQAAQARVAGAESLRLVTGNPHTRRDFTDVRDVVRAYRMLAADGAPGVYNVATGRSISAAEQVELLAELIAPVRVEHVVDPARVRAHEVMELAGSPEKIEAAVGWRPEIPFRETMRQTVQWWERELSRVSAR